MSPYRRSLEVIQIARPCPEDWEALEGDGPMRFCGRCEQNVYDLSALTAAEAEELLALFEGKTCARMVQRADGTLVSADCTDARTRGRRRRVLRLMAAGVASVGLVAATFGAATFAAATTDPRPEPTPRDASPSPRAHRGEYSQVGGIRAPSRARERPAFEGSWVDPEALRPPRGARSPGRLGLEGTAQAHCGLVED